MDTSTERTKSKSRKSRKRKNRTAKSEPIPAEEGVLTTPEGHALPRVLDPKVTMDLVQRYVETERALEVLHEDHLF